MSFSNFPNFIPDENKYFLCVNAGNIHIVFDWLVTNSKSYDVDIKNLTKEDAKDIYKKDYWDRNKVDELPDDLKHIFFDMCVNQGRGTAVKILQRACNAKGADLAVDGGFGPGTKGAIESYKPSLDRVRCYRLKHYYDLVNKRPEQERFLYGWYKRAISI